MTPQNIVLVNDCGSPVNAPSMIAIESALALAQKGFSVVFFCAAPPVDARLLATPGLRVVCTGQPTLRENPSRLAAFAQGLHNTQARRQFTTVLAGFSPQNTVVHFHLWAKALSPALFSVAGRAGFAVFITAHEYYSVCPNGGLLHYPARRPCGVHPMGLRCLAQNCDRHGHAQKGWRVARQLLQNRGLRHAKQLILLAPSQLSFRILSSSFLAQFPMGRLFYLPNFIRALPGAGKAISFAQNSHYLFVGRLEPEKGIELFCRALAALGLTGIAIGGTPAPGQLSQLRKAHPHVQFTGHLSPQEMLPHIRTARALVFPSIWPEGMGLVPFELLMNYHIPCIISNASAPRQLARECAAVLLFKSGCQRSLQCALLQMQNNARVHAMQAAAQAQNFSRYGIEAHLHHLLALYATQSALAARCKKFGPCTPQGAADD